MRKQKIVKESIKIAQVDENGELTAKSEKVTYRIAKEPEFVKLYLADLMLLRGLPKSHTAVLYSLLRHMNYADDKNGQVVVVNSFVKREILMENQDIMSTQTVTNAISNLKKHNILQEVGRAAYRVNPRIIGKGEWRDIQNLRLNIFYDETGRTVSADFGYSNSDKIINMQTRAEVDTEE